MTIPEHRLTAGRAHRVEDACVLFNPGMDVGIGPEWQASTLGAATIAKLANNSAIQLAVSSASGDVAILVSRDHFRASGLGLRYGATVVHGDAGQAAQTRIWGRYDSDEGVYFRLNGTTLELVWATRTTGTVVREAIPSASWNAKNTTVDVTKLHVYEIEVGPTVARCFVDGELVHTFSKAGTISAAFSKWAAQPWGASIVNSAPSVAGTMTVTDAFVWSEGDPPRGLAFLHAREAAASVAGVPLFSVRPKSTVRATVHPTRLSARTGAQGCTFRVVLGGTLTGASWGDVDASSYVEKDEAATLAGGTVVAELCLGPDQGGELDLTTVFGRARRSLSSPISAAITGDILTVVAIAASGTPTGRAALHWNEVR